MRTTGTLFDNQKHRTGVVTRIVAELQTSGGTTILTLSDKPINWTGGNVYPIIESLSNVSEAVDMRTRVPRTSSATLKINNARFTYQSDVKVRFSEYVYDSGSILDKVKKVKVYLIAGETATSVSDGMLLFYGRVTSMPKVTTSCVELKLQDLSSYVHATIPSTLMADTFASCPEKIAAKPIPLVYGSFNHRGYLSWSGMTATGYSFDHAGNGLLSILPTTREDFPKYVVADHVMDAIGGVVYADFGYEDPGKYDFLTATANPATATLDDSGCGTITTDEYRAIIPSPLLDNADDDYSWTSSYTAPDDVENIMDADLTTYSTWTDSQDDGTAIMHWSGYHVNWPNAGSPASARFEAYLLSYTAWGVLVPDITAWFVKTDEGYMMGTGGTVPTYQITGSPGWTCNSTPFSINATVDPKPDGVVITMGLSNSVLADSTTDNFDCCDVYDFRIMYEMCDAPCPSTRDCFCSGDGLAYGSWVTESGRSNGHAVGDVIEDPAMIIESILRDVLGVATTDIDTTMFDAALNGNVEARIQMLTQKNSAKYVQQIVEQSTFVYICGARGKHRAIPLTTTYWSSKSVDATIPWPRIIPGSLTVDYFGPVVNKLNVESGYQQETKSKYWEHNTYTDSTSVTDFGEFAASVKWQNVNGTSASTVAGFLIGATGRWSQRRLQVKFSTYGIMYADLEVGDCISLDSTSVDPHMKAMDESWSGKKFMVVSATQQGAGRTTITAIEMG